MFNLSPRAEAFVPNLSISIPSSPQPVTWVPASSSTSDPSRLDHPPVFKTLSPYAVAFSPRTILTPPVTPPPPSTFRAGCNFSPSHKEATKVSPVDAWRKKKKRTQYTPPHEIPVFHSFPSKVSHPTHMLESKSSFSVDIPTSSDLTSPSSDLNLCNLSNPLQEIVVPHHIARRQRLMPRTALPTTFKRSRSGSYWHIIRNPSSPLSIHQILQDYSPVPRELESPSSPRGAGDRSPSMGFRPIVTSARMKACQCPIRGYDPG